jgi:hypothetical protein
MHEARQLGSSLTQVGTEGEKRVCLAPQGAGFFQCCRASRVSSDRIPALVSDIIAPLHFSYDPIEQTGADHLVLAKLWRHVLRKGRALTGRSFAACMSRSKSRSVSLNRS